MNIKSGSRIVRLDFGVLGMLIISRLSNQVNDFEIVTVFMI